MNSPRRLFARSGVIGASVSAASTLLCLVLLFVPASAAAAAPAIAVSPTSAVVGSTITITGSGFPPNTSLALGWVSHNASWKIQAIPTPQVTGVKTTPLVYRLGSATSDASGSFSVQITVPSDYGGSHAIQAYAANGTAVSPVAAFTLEPHFQISPTSGPAGTPIHVVATGLGTSLYSTTYHLYWDNAYVGYMTALSTGGATNFTFYASGTPGPHYVGIFEGYPGPGVFNPQEANPHSSIAWSYYSPPNIPFLANFTITPENVVAQPAASTTGAAYTATGTGLGASALVVALAGSAIFVAKKEPEEREAISKAVAALAIVALVAVGGVGLYVLSGQQGGAGPSSQYTSGPQVTFTPVAKVVRPHITVPQNNVTTGPRISVSPDIASVGDSITVKGLGFAAGAQLPITWTTREGSNVLGYKIVDRPLKNVTTGADGAFEFNMTVPPDLGGIHFVAAGNLTERSNGTLFIQRTATMSRTEGPSGTQVEVIMKGVGWDFNTNIAAFDYDNSYVGYGCGFSSGGNVTFIFVASGSPGIHTIDVYPSIWWGPSNFADQQAVEYRYPILTPQDHPELMPSFHFTFLVTP